jgi:hypothetical protein
MMTKAAKMTSAGAEYSQPILVCRKSRAGLVPVPNMAAVKRPNMTGGQNESFVPVKCIAFSGPILDPEMLGTMHAERAVVIAA